MTTERTRAYGVTMSTVATGTAVISTVLLSKPDAIAQARAQQNGTRHVEFGIAELPFDLTGADWPLGQV